MENNDENLHCKSDYRHLVLTIKHAVSVVNWYLLGFFNVSFKEEKV